MLQIVELLPYTTLPVDWKAQYYEEIRCGFEEDLTSHLLKDTKHIEWKGTPFCFGQIEVWNAQTIMDSFRREFSSQAQQMNWIVNLVSIEEGKSFLFCNHGHMKDFLLSIVSGKDCHELIAAPRLWLRKELIKKLCH